MRSSKPINRQVSMPVSLMGLDIDDFVAAMGLFGACLVLNQFLWGLALGIGALVALRKVKRRSPMGILPQLGYHFGLIRHPSLPRAPILAPRRSLSPEVLEWSPRGVEPEG